MRVEQFASLTADLLMRKSEAKPPAIVPSEPIAFPGISRRSLAPRADASPARRAIIAPLGVEPNRDGSVTLSIAGAAENFRHDEEARGWAGACGSFLRGDGDLFAETTGWCVAISWEQNRDAQIELRHHGRRLRIDFDGFAAAMSS